MFPASLQLELERAEVDRLIRERMSDYDKRLAEYKHRMQKGEVELNELRIKLLEYEHLMWAAIKYIFFT